MGKNTQTVATDTWEMDAYKDFESVDELDPILICTSYESSTPKEEFNWFFHLLDPNGIYDRMNLPSELYYGRTLLCDCAECRNLGKKLNEYYSTCSALRLVRETSPEREIELWVGSSEFIEEIENGLFEIYKDRYQCDFLRRLCRDLNSLLEELRVELFHYTYGNKDSITHFF